MFSFVEKYAKHHPQLKEDSLAFMNDFSITKSIIRQFEKMVKEINIKYAYFPFDRYHSQLKFFLKRELAYIYWGQMAQYQFHLTADEQFQQAIKYFEKANQLLVMTQWVKNSKVQHK